MLTYRTVRSTQILASQHLESYSEHTQTELSHITTYYLCMDPQASRNLTVYSHECKEMFEPLRQS